MESIKYIMNWNGFLKGKNTPPVPGPVNEGRQQLLAGWSKSFDLCHGAVWSALVLCVVVTRGTEHATHLAKCKCLSTPLKTRPYVGTSLSIVLTAHPRCSARIHFWARGNIANDWLFMLRVLVYTYVF